MRLFVVRLNGNTDYINVTWRKGELEQLARGTALAQWLRCCATNRKVVGSIPAGVIGIFEGPATGGKVLRPATSTQAFLCFPVPKSKC